MWAIVGLLVVGIFFLGIGAAVYLAARLFTQLFNPSSSTARSASAPRPPNRDTDLNTVARETLRAFAAGKLSIGARDEMLAYVDSAKAEERQKLEVARLPNQKPEMPSPVISIISVPATKSNTPTQPIAPPVPPPPQPAPQPPTTQRDPAEVRAAIQRLHEHALECADKSGALNSASDAQLPLPALAPLSSTPLDVARCPEPVEGFSHEKERASQPRTGSGAQAFTQPTPKRGWAERLFTPENVRILQSLGIGLIFFSAVAYVRTQMWDTASAMTQMLMLMGGTAACLGLGFALRRWTDLRITGLGFLILGHLSMVLDAYAALVPTSATAQPLYHFQPGSLWTVTLTIFTISACWHARALKEPLFEAFTFFGAMAAWGAGAQWLEIGPWHLAIAYLPALLICRFAYPLLAESADILRRWSLPWWLRSAWELGAPLLLFVELTVCLLLGASDLQNDLGIHLAALTALGLAALWDAHVSPRKQMAHFSALALLSLAPLAAFAHGWPLWSYPMALALPAAGLSLAALGWQTWGLKDRQDASELFLGWGLTIVSAAAAAAAIARLVEPEAAASTAWSAAALSAVGASLVACRSSVAGAWLAVAGNALLSAMVLELTGVGLHWLPPLWLVFALATELWSVYARTHLLSETARDQADTLTIGASLGGLYYLMSAPHAIWTFTSTASGLYGSAPAYQFVILAAATTLLLLTSAIRRQAWRCSTGVALLGPTLLYGLSACGIHIATPALWCITLTAAAWVALEALVKKEEDCGLLSAGRLGAGLLLLQSLLLSCLDLARPDYAMAAWDFLAMGVLLSIVAMRARKMELGHERCVVLESVALAFLSGAGLCAAATWHLSIIAWVSLYPILAGLVLLSSLSGEVLCGGVSKVRPFRAAGEWVALLISGVGLGEYLFRPGLLPACPLHMVWLSILPTLFIVLRNRWTPAVEKPVDREPTLTSVAAAVHIMTVMLLCFGVTIHHQFWSSGIPASTRAECATFFAVLLLLGVMLGTWLRSAFAPIMVGSATLALTACVYGGCGLSYMTFGLPAMLTALSLLGLAYGLQRESTRSHPGQALSAHIMGSLIALLAVGWLLFALAFGPKDGLQAASLTAWLMASLALWYAGRGAWPDICGFGCSLSLLLAGMHGLRWGAVEFTAFGPAIGAFALVLLALREAIEFFDKPRDDRWSALRGRSGGFLAAAFCSMLLAGLFGLAGHFDDRPWHWVGTLCEGAIFLGALSVLSRRRATGTRGSLLLVTELSMWLGLLMATGFGMEAAGYGFMLKGVLWAGIGALVLLIGMMLETAAGAVVGPSAQSRVPGAFLESRHLVAAGCAGLGLLTALVAPQAVERIWMEGIWQACLGAALLAVYGSLSRSSISASAANAARYGSALAAYVVLLPLGYLAFLKSQSTGDSYGALWFLALAPALMGISWLLEQEREMEQAALARFGALLVSGGSLVLAFAANSACLPEVPAWTFFGLMVEALLMRRWSQRKEWTLAALAALSGASLYAIRALHGDPAWGLPEAWVWEGTIVATLGLLMTVVGGAFRLERDANERSLVGQFGGVLNFLCVGLMLVGLLVHGRSAGYLGFENTARLDAFNIALILSAAAAFAAWQWLRFAAGCWLAPAQLLTAYALSLWAWHVVAWEYYTIPVGLACFFWARQSERSGTEQDALASRIWQILGCAFLLIPSFALAMPYSPESVWHSFGLAALALLLVGGAMWTRRKIPLLSASSALLLCTIIKTAQWAAHHNATLPAAGFALGVSILLVGSVFESRMNRVVRTAADQVKAQARMFWTNWD